VILENEFFMQKMRLREIQLLALRLCFFLTLTHILAQERERVCESVTVIVMRNK